jgi:chromosome segregation ATPase
VGRLAAYRTAVLNGNAIEEDYARALATLDGLDEPARSVADIDAAIGVATGDLAQAEADRAVLEAELEAAGGSDSAIEAEIAAKTGEINQLAAEIGTLEDERADAANYEEAAEAVALLDDQLTEQQDLERSLLDAAANKPVTDAVVAQVNALLGLE